MELSGLLFLTCCCLVAGVGAYNPPMATVEPLKPAGIRVSIPHESGISLVAFHININEDFYALEAGMIARDIIKQRNGRWVYQDKTTQLQENDVVYYWVHVVYRGLGYNLLNQEHRVKDFYDYNGNKIQSFGIIDESNMPELENNSGNSGHGECRSLSATKLYDSFGSRQTSPCAGKLVFSEDFRSSDAQWTTLEQFNTAPDYEFVVYRDSPRNVKIRNGLKLTPTLLSEESNDTFVRYGELKLNKCTGNPRGSDCLRKGVHWNILPPVASGRLNTKKSFNFQYGRVEIRAKLPKGDWIYPLLMLETAKANPNGRNQNIRVASSAGNVDLRSKDGLDISGHVLWGGVVEQDNRQQFQRVNEFRSTKVGENPWSDAYHTYELIWTLDRISLKVDGQVYDERSVNVPNDTPFFLTLGLAVGGLSEFPDYCTSSGSVKPWRNIGAKAVLNFYTSQDTWRRTWTGDDESLKVDYVKIYAL
ncbi:hypothetical protein TKK_0014939 [Trichogramma kaykai]|uniref:Uncharacterized protein n=1 Tax=Trichogramma kaykai TaxID=54128 RepID=A0ABD2WD83_9HYME